jgi:hypothetical protein
VVKEKIFSSFYWIGVFAAIFAGVLSNSGIVLQKKVINDLADTLPRNKSPMKYLIKEKWWIGGLILNFGIGTIFYLIAQSLIGPALIPGLMSSGLIILALGSVYILDEQLCNKEIFGIFLMIIAITFLGFSQLSIEIANNNIISIDFLLRVSIFSFSLVGLSIFLEGLSRNADSYQGVPLSIISGIMFALSNLWVSILIGTISKVFEGIFVVVELVLFVVAAIILIFTNAFGVIKMQQAFTVGQAGNLIVIQQIPIQISPILIYFLVFFLPLTNLISILFLLSAISLIIISAYLLGKRQIEIDQIG